MEICDMIERFPGISCAYMDARGKEIVEYYGVSDKEKDIWWMIILFFLPVLCQNLLQLYA